MLLQLEIRTDENDGYTNECLKFAQLFRDCDYEASVGLLHLLHDVRLRAKRIGRGDDGTQEHNRKVDHRELRKVGGQNQHHIVLLHSKGC